MHIPNELGCMIGYHKQHAICKDISYKELLRIIKYVKPIPADKHTYILACLKGYSGMKKLQRKLGVKVDPHTWTDGHISICRMLMPTRPDDQ